MFNQILVATDGSKSATRAVETAIEVALGLSAKLVILNVVAGPSLTALAGAPSAEELGSALKEQAQQIVDAGAKRARARGISNVEVRVVWGDVCEAILAEAKRERADAIIVGRRGLGRLAGLLIGGVSQKIVSLAPCPVIVIP